MKAVGRAIRVSAVGSMCGLLLVACGTGSNQSSTSSPRESPFASHAASPSPVVSLPPLLAGWTWYADSQRGYSVGIAPQWSARSQVGLACPAFVSNPALVDRWQPGQALPTDEGFSLCAVPATSCETPHDNGAYTPIIVAGVATNESTIVINDNRPPDGFRGYSVDLPANSLCYELHLMFMPGVSEERVVAVRAAVWASFTVYPPRTSVASAAG